MQLKDLNDEVEEANKHIRAIKNIIDNQYSSRIFKINITENE